MTAPLLPVELRLLTPFATPGLEGLRKSLLSVLSTSPDPELRARAILLTAHTNDFRPVFADVLPVPANVLREPVAKPRGLFDVYNDVSLLREALRDAQTELSVSGLSKGYMELIHTRVYSHSPQQVVSAACALVIFGAMVAPSP